MKESAFWATVKKALPMVHWCRIENSAGTGMSDVNGCFNGVEVWVELKMIRSGKIEIRPTQKAWITQRMRAGGRVFIMARDEHRLVLWNGWRAIREDVEPYLEMRKPFDWTRVRSHLFGA